MRNFSPTLLCIKVFHEESMIIYIACSQFVLVSFSGVRFLNVTLGDGDAAMNVDVLESCSAAEMFSDWEAIQ